MDLGTRGKLVVLVCEVLQNMVVTIIVNNPLSRLTRQSQQHLSTPINTTPINTYLRTFIN